MRYLIVGFALVLLMSAVVTQGPAVYNKFKLGWDIYHSENICIQKKIAKKVERINIHRDGLGGCYVD